MTTQLYKGVILLVFCVLPACGQPSLYHWGEYEENLYLRATDTSEKAQAEAVRMLESTINEAEENNARLAPGVYADYGYLLLKQGRTQEAMANFKKEAGLYPESKYFMDSVISRIQDKEKS